MLEHVQDQIAGWIDGLDTAIPRQEDNVDLTLLIYHPDDRHTKSFLEHMTFTYLVFGHASLSMKSRMVFPFQGLSPASFWNDTSQKNITQNTSVDQVNLESWNHKRFYVGREVTDHIVPSHLPWVGSPTPRLPKAPFNLALNTSRAGTSKVPHHTHSEEFLPNLNLPSLSLQPYPILHSLIKNPFLSFL